MSNYYNLDNVPPLLQQFIKQYQQQQSSSDYMSMKPTSENIEQPAANYDGKSVFEINSKADLEYIKPDETGRKQIFICEPENKVYIGKYNYARKKPDFKSFTDDGEINLFQQQNDTSAVMDKISEALVMIANKLDSMDKDIQAIKPKSYPINKHKKAFEKEEDEC